MNRILTVLTALAASALLALGVAACGSSNDSSSTAATTSTTTSVGAPGASVEFVSPKDGTTTGSTVDAKVKVAGFTLAPDQVGKAAKQGEGHLHFSMDGGKYDLPKYSGANGKLAVKLGVDGQYSPSVTPTITYSNLPDGQHTLEVSLANNDHTDTGVHASTTFVVKSAP